MAKSDDNADNASSGNANNGSGGATDSSSSNNDDAYSDAVKPSETPKAATGSATNTSSQNTDAEAAEGLARTKDEPRQEVKKEEGLSLDAAFTKARNEGILMGISDARSLTEYVRLAGNNMHQGIAYNPIEAVRKTAGDMAAALAQFKIESNLATHVAVADHANIGSGVSVSRGQAATVNYTLTA